MLVGGEEGRRGNVASVLVRTKTLEETRVTEHLETGGKSGRG